MLPSDPQRVPDPLRKVIESYGMDRFGVLFGKLVRVRRGNEEWSQDRLAAESGLTKARISDLELGKIPNPHVKTVDLLCVALRISPEDRAACHPTPVIDVPPLLLRKAATKFGRDVPDATEEELEAIFTEKAKEFHEMRERLEKMAETEGRISELVWAANAALGDGDFEAADSFLGEAEAVQLESSTTSALKKLAELRIERGNAALVNGNVSVAVSHFERSSSYFSGVKAELEAENRRDCVALLRYYGYRYRSVEALYAAKGALDRNLGIWKQGTHVEQWCLTKNALGGVCTRLSHFDLPENAMLHLEEAKTHLENIRSVCSEGFLPKSFATAGLDLANVYSSRQLAKSDAEFEKNLQSALSLQLSSLRFFSKVDDPRGWGIIQHNLGCSYIDLSNLRADEAKSAADIANAIRHLELSFEVRNPDDSLQYWVASCRSLGEALLNMSTYSVTKNSAEYVQRASEVLSEAAAKISPSEHPHQWAEIQSQLARFREPTPR